MFTVFQPMKLYLHTELLDTKLLVFMLPKTLRPPFKDLVPVIPIGHFTVVCLVTGPWIGREARVDLV